MIVASAEFAGRVDERHCQIQRNEAKAKGLPGPPLIWLLPEGTTHI